MMVRGIGLAALGVSVALIAGCGGDDGSTQAANGAPTYGNCTVGGKFGETPIKSVESDTLTVETSLPSPGWWNGDTPAGIKDGYEYCMAANIAYRGGLRHLQIRPVSFDALVAGQTRDFDLALVTISITPEREKVVDFTPPYFGGDVGVVVAKDSKLTGATMASAQIGVQQGTVAQTYVEQHIKPAKKIKVFPDTASMWTAVQAGQIDAAVNDTAQALAVVKRSAGALKVLGQYKTGESYGGLYPQGSPNGRAFDKIVTGLKQDGTLSRLSSTYLAKAFGGDPAKVPYLTPAA
jgi:polar amino acid transport system substrate-binding protein